MLSFISSSAAIGLILAIQAQGHALITPALGGGTQRSDVKRPNNLAPCGRNVDIASLMSTSEAVPVTNGQIAVTVTNFNPTIDGSRKVSAQIDPTGTGNSFQEATVTTNGELAPLDLSSQPIVVQVPEGMQSTNGMMLVSFKNAFGFGNCVVATDSATGASNSTATDTTTGTGTGTDTTPTGTEPTAQGAAPATGGGLLAGLGLKSKAGQKNRIRSARFRLIENFD